MPAARPRRLTSGRAAVTTLGLALLAVVAVTTRSSPAVAHAYVISTTPANGEQVDVWPDAIEVTFSEPVTLYPQGRAIRVLDADGEEVGDGTRSLDAGRSVLTIGLLPDQSHGTYLASWSVISADSHPVGGSIRFGYGVPASPFAGDTERQPSGTLTLMTGVTKAVVYGGYVVGFGLVPAALLLGAADVERRRIAAAARAALDIAIAASLAQVVVQFLWTDSALPPGVPSDPAAFATSSYAVAVWLRVAALSAAAALVPTTASRARLVGFGVAAAVALGTTVRNGHGATGDWWKFAATFLHGAAAIAWLGGLAALGWLLLQRRVDGERLQLLPRWSIWAAGSVAVLAVSGTVQAIVGVGFWPALLTTRYGVVLLVKLALVAVALALAASANRWVRTNAGRRAGARPVAGAAVPGGETTRLRRRVRVEAVVGAVVVLLSGVLGSITPGEAAYAPRATIETTIGPYAVTVEIGPTRVGPQQFRVVVTPPTANAPLPRALDLVVARVDGSLTGLTAEFPYRIPGTLSPGEPTPFTFVSSALNVPEAGRWRATLTVVAGPFEQYTAAFDYGVR